MEISPRQVLIPPIELEGLLRLPEEPKGLVIFAHGSGSGRLSARNNYVANALGDVGLGTLLFDLLTRDEEHDRANVFDIDLLAGRVLQAVAWVAGDERLRHYRVGLFGASTGAAAALVAASRRPDVAAIVSRGGRPDLAGAALRSVRTPTLLIVGSRDREVLGLNQAALAQLPCEKDLRLVPGASHLFEEPGALDQVVGLSERWFLDHLHGGQAP